MSASNAIGAARLPALRVVRNLVAAGVLVAIAAAFALVSSNTGEHATPAAADAEVASPRCALIKSAASSRVAGGYGPSLHVVSGRMRALCLARTEAASAPRGYLPLSQLYVVADDAPAQPAGNDESVLTFRFAMSRVPEGLLPADMLARVQVLSRDAQGQWRTLPRSFVHLYTADRGATRSRIDVRVNGAGSYMVAFAATAAS